VKRAIVSDIHGNVEALRAVLADIEQQQVDGVVCLGDIVGYGPDPLACIDASMDFSFSILGNHDLGALFDPEGFSSGAEKAIFWTRQQLESRVPDVDPDGTQAKRRWSFLAELPRNHRENGTLFVHGSARNPLNEYVFPEDIYNKRKIEKIFSVIETRCFQGHTHVPGVFTEDARFMSPEDVSYRYEFGKARTMINVGSVGQPRDGDPRSCYVILHDSGVEFRRVDYDANSTAAKIYDIPELDNFLGDRLKEGR